MFIGVAGVDDGGGVDDDGGGDDDDDGGGGGNDVCSPRVRVLESEQNYIKDRVFFCWIPSDLGTPEGVT